MLKFLDKYQYSFFSFIFLEFLIFFKKYQYSSYVLTMIELSKREDDIMANLSLKNICKTYPNGFQAVKDFNIDIEDKEFIIFVGPSGCGKSTVLRMIAGLEDITSGELIIGDRVCNDIEPKDRDIAMVFQNYALYPHMTVAENIAFGLKIRKTPQEEIDRLVNEVAELLGLEKLLDRKPKALSGGQRQRVAMGRAIVRNPKVFLMDEPLSNLDAKLRVQMRVVISQLYQKLGTTFIYVTHDQTEAMTLGTRIVVLKDGVIQQIDTPQNLYNHPTNLFVATFIGSPQMNLIDAKVTLQTDGIYLELPNGVKFRPDESKEKALMDGRYIGKTVVLGIRPEDIYDNYEFISKHQDTSFDSLVDVYETLGSEVFLYFTIGDNKITARVDPRSQSRAGKISKFALDTSRIHLFDKDSENVIE